VAGYQREQMLMRTHSNSDHKRRGFTLIELLIAVTVGLIITGIALGTLATLTRNLKAGGDASDLNSTVVLARMRAASKYARARVYADLAANTFRVEWQQAGTSTWTSEGGDQPLSSGISFGYGSLGTAPPSTQTTIGQPATCSGAANTACIIFNSRGIPIDSSGNAMSSYYGLYVTDGKNVAAVTVSPTGLTQIWRTDAAGANWVAR
jgi:prepilin-type N-terminal cleavage/methylation domain-containing protein